MAAPTENPVPWATTAAAADRNDSLSDAAANAGHLNNTTFKCDNDNRFKYVAYLWLEFLRTESMQGVCGDGDDGAQTFGAGVTTLSRNIYATTVVVESGATLQTNGFKLFAQVSVTVDAGGVIENDGADAGTAPAAGAGAGAGTLGGGSAGGAGGSVANGTAGTGSSLALGGTAGAGGDSNDTGFNYTGGAAGVATAPTPSEGGTRHMEIAHGRLMGTSNFRVGGGAGGGGGGGGDSGDGGGGGGGGGIVSIFTPELINNGTIRANGGAGGAAVNADASGNGGGGGGGGGAVLLVRRRESGSGTVEAVGGAGGAGFGLGDDGAAGATGAVRRWTI